MEPASGPRRPAQRRGADGERGGLQPLRPRRQRAGDDEHPPGVAEELARCRQDHAPVRKIRRVGIGFVLGFGLGNCICMDIYHTRTFRVLHTLRIEDKLLTSYDAG